jgi:hypothetical protein
MLCSKKVELGILEVDNTRHTNAFRRAGHIPSRTTDLLSHMSTARVLEGLRYDADYMVELEKEKQYGDRCILASTAMGGQPKCCLAEVDRYLALVAQFQTACSNVSQDDAMQKLSNALSKNEVDLTRADAALVRAMEAYEAELGTYVL